MYKKSKLWLFRLLICMFFAATLFSEEYNTISNDLFKYFSQKNMNSEIQYLQNSQSNQFPYSIILPFTDEISNTTALYFIFSQKTSQKHPEFVHSFSSAGTVLLAANMESALPVSIRKESFPGLRTFLNDLSPESLIILISESDDLDTDEMELIPGGNGLIASKDMVQSVLQASRTTGFSMSIQSLLLSFYRLNWVEGSEAASICLENGFQAVELVISSTVSPNRLKTFAGNLHDIAQTTDFSEGMQYSIINAGSQIITISESLYTQFLFCILGITLLGSCLLSFMFGQRKTENRTIFLKWWYLGPLLVLLTFFLTWLSQSIIISLFKGYQVHPGYAIFLKASLLTVLFLLICEVRYIIPLAQTDYLYSFFMILSAALAVFIYTSVDMPLLLPFSAIYIIFLSARSIKKWWLNICLFIAELIPLIYVLLRATPYLKQSVFISLTESSPLMILFTSILLLPYLLMLIHIFVTVGIWDNAKGKKRIHIETLVLSGLFIILLLISAVSYRNDTGNAYHDNTYLSQPQDNDSNLFIQAEAQYGNGMISFELLFDSKDTVLRYDVSAESSSSIPVYSSNIPFTFSSKPGQIYFNLDEYPCNPFIITGIAPSVLPVEFSVTAWYLNDKYVYSEEYSVVFAEENAGKKQQIKAIIKQ